MIGTTINNICMIPYIIGTFLLGNLALGLWAGRGVKTMEDYYALANRSLSTGADDEVDGYLYWIG